MRNFTLGKNGIPLFFFALFLFSGTYSYGQNCPTVTDSTQLFCDAEEPQIQDLAVSGDNVAWYAEIDSQNPLPETQILLNGENYFAGNPDDPNCDRVEVVVTVLSEPEILGINATTSRASKSTTKQSLAVLGICVEDVDNPTVTVGDLRTDYDDVAGVEVNWYYTRTSTDPIPASTPLQNNTDYFAGLTVTGSTIDGECQTNRSRTTVQFFSQPAPEGPADQTFCASENPTLADIEVSGNNRYFTNATSLTELSGDTPLVDGRTYYISAVGERCESTERLAVTVTVTPSADLGTPDPGIVCELDVQETFPSDDAIKNYYLSLLPEGTPTNGTFNPTPGQIANQYQNDADGLGDFTTTYTVGCDQVDLTVSIIPTEEAYAGEDREITLGLTDAPIDLYDYITGQGAIETGYFVEYPDGTFDPAVEGEGTYTVTYTVDETSGCITGTASATFTIIVAPCEADAGADVDSGFCQSEAEALAAELSAAGSEEERNTILATWLGDRDTDGTFSGDPGTELATAYLAGVYPFTVATTYIVGEGECEDQAEISVTIYEDVYAGEDGTVTLNEGDDPVNLIDYLGGSPDQGGTWSPGNGTFDPATDPAGTYTYTVGTEGCTDSADVIVSVTQDPTTPGVGAGVVCLDDVQTIFPSFDEIRKYYLNLLPVGVDRNGTLNPTARQIGEMYQADEDGLGEFTTVYTASNGETYELTVNIVTEAEAGNSTTVPLTTEDDPVNLFDYLGEDALPGGTWSSGNGTFDPATDEEGSFTYTVGYEGCMDSATVTVTVTDTTEPCEANAGADVDEDLCQSEAEALAAQLFAAQTDEERDAILATWLGNRDTNGTFTGDPGTELATKYSAGIYPFSVSTTYVVGEGECEDQAEITVTIYEDVYAGEDGTVTLNEGDDPVNLIDYLGGSPDQGGTWSPGNGTFDPATDEPGTYTYTVGEGCTDSADVIVSVNPDPTDPTSPGVGAGVVCLDDVQTIFPSFDEIRKYYLNLLPSGVDRNGTLNPTARQIGEMYQADEDGLGEFTTVYTASNGETYELTVNIVTEAEAGNSTTVTLTTEDDPVNLFDYLGEDALPGGTWSSGNGTFDPATDEEGSFTYTVGYEGCMDSATVTVTVTDTTEPCEANAGADNSDTVCNSQVASLSAGAVRNLYLGLLEAGVPTNGTFNPTIQQIIDQYNFQSNFGDFTTEYTVVSGECQDSATLTITVLENPDAGVSNEVPLEEGTTETVDLFDELGGTPEEGGTWTFGGEEVNGTFDPATDEEGAYTYTVTSENGCSASAVVTIGTQEPNCPEVTETEQTFCPNSTVANLQPTDAVWYATEDSDEPLSAGTLLADQAVYYAGNADGTCDARNMVTVTLSGPEAPTVVTPFVGCAVDAPTVADLEITPDDGFDFQVYTDADLTTVASETDVLVDGEVYYVTQTSEGCESEAAMVTITLTTPEAPTVVTPFEACVADQATVADLDITTDDGFDFQVYSNEALTTPLETSELLVSGTYYVTQTSDAGCESEAETVTVVLEDSEAPSLSTGGNVFCEFDDATVGDLEENIVGNGTITWYTSATGTGTYSSSDVLQDGTTYYAAVTPTGECESSDRLPVTVDLEDCEIVIPDAFSPNDDDINDTFVVDNLASEYPNFRMEIYNRWGEPVYNGGASTPSWDGTSTEGSLGSGVLPAGVYFYILYFNDGQTAPTQGRLYLSR